MRLVDTGGGDSRGSATVLDGAGRGTASLDGLDDADGGGITGDDLTEDNVTTIQPASNDCGDEELRAVAKKRSVCRR